MTFTDAGGGSLIQGNYIGTDVSGTQRLGNSGDGIQTDFEASYTIDSNVVSGNGGTGINTKSAVIQQNLVGVDASGTQALGNLGDGIQMVPTVPSTITRNIVSGNGGNGILLSGFGVSVVFSEPDRDRCNRHKTDSQWERRYPDT